MAIIGAGATGIELAAELHRTTREVVAYGLDRIDPEKDIKITLIEAAPRILPAVPERVSEAPGAAGKLDVDVHTNARVTEVRRRRGATGRWRLLPSELVVWAAGVKAPDVLHDLDGLETSRINQLVVPPTLQTTRDANIFAIGDCAACAWPEEGRTAVPPRAQAAHQQATHLVRQIRRRLAGQPLQPYRYRDFGSLVSLGEYTTVGNLMGGLSAAAFLSKAVRRMMYQSLYKMHELRAAR